MGVAVWAAYENRPERTSAVERELSRLLRLDVRVSGYRTPRPGDAEADRIAISRAGARGPILELANVRLQRGTAHVIVSAERMDGYAAGINALARAAADGLASPAIDAARFQIEAVEIHPPLAGSLRPLRLRNVGAKFVAHRVDGEGGAGFKLAASSVDGRAPLELDVRRTPDKRTIARIDAANLPLPAWLALHRTPLADLAPDASFRGVVQWTSRDNRLMGRLSGRLQEFDLSQLLPRGSLHTAAGPAELEISELKYTDQSIDRIAGVLASSEGTFSESLAAAAQTHLLCRRLAPQGDDPHRFDALRVQFEIDHRGVTITGGLPPHGRAGAPAIDASLPAECLAAVDGSPLMLEPGHVELFIEFLPQFATGYDGRWVPANEGAIELLARLPRPLPKPASPATSPKSQ